MRMMEAPGLRVAVKKSVPVTLLEQRQAHAGDCVPMVVLTVVVLCLDPPLLLLSTQ